MRKLISQLFLLLFGMLGLLSTSHAELTDLGNGLVNDTSLDITWMKDANLFKTLCDANDPIVRDFVPPFAAFPQGGVTVASICAENGRIDLANAQAWVERLNNLNYLGYSDWRQPVTTQPDESCDTQASFGQLILGAGYNCTGSELGHLFNVTLGNPNDEGTGVNGGIVGTDCYPNEPLNCFFNTGPFINTQANRFWAGSPAPGSFDGNQFLSDLGSGPAWIFNTSRGYQATGSGFFDINNIWLVRSGLSVVKPQEPSAFFNDTSLDISWVSDANLFKTLCDADDPIATGFIPPAPDTSGAGTNASSICANNGKMTWGNAQGWIERLNSQSYLGYSDWRHPQTAQPDASCENQAMVDAQSVSGGFNCTASELGHLFNVTLDNPNDAGTGATGGTTGTDCFGSGTAPQHCFQNTGDFINSKPARYWTNREAPGFFSSYSSNTFVTVSSYRWVFNTNKGVQESAHEGFNAEQVWPVRGGQSVAAPVDLGNGLINDSSLNITWMKDANLFKTLCDANHPIATQFLPPITNVPGLGDITAASICANNGKMTWGNAHGWIKRLNSQSYLGYSDWRQPTTPEPDDSCDTQAVFEQSGLGAGYNCTGSELGHLFNVTLGNPNDEGTAINGGKIGTDCFPNAPQHCFLNTGSFINTQANTFWAGNPAPGSFNGSEFRDDSGSGPAWVFNTSKGYQTTDSGWFNTQNVWPVRSGLSIVISSGNNVPIISIIQLLLLNEE